MRTVITALVSLTLVAAACAASVPAVDGQPFDLEKVADLEWPTAMAQRPGNDEIYVTEQPGRVRLLQAPGSPLEPELVLDLTDEVNEPKRPTGGEAGLLGIAISGDDRMYLSITENLEPGRGPWVRKVVEYTLSDGLPDPASRRVLLSYEKEHVQHNAGDLRFGPDGFLYVGLGDGSPTGDAFDTGQNPRDLPGAIIRIDPTGGNPYSVPADNPFVGTEKGADEVWVYGLRNPWRFSFDRQTGDLWIADVGDLNWEEINHLPPREQPGANLGWSMFEGSHRFGDSPTNADVTFPVHEYDHTNGCAVIGGYVYRGQDIASLHGLYLFGDFCGRWLAGLRLEGSTSERAFTTDLPDAPLAFGEDADGEIYLLMSKGVFRLVAAEG